MTTNPWGLNPIRLRGEGDLLPGEPPARPWESSGKIARDLLRYVGDAAPEIFTSPGGKQPPRQELLSQFEGLRGSIVREMGNRPPVVEIVGGGVYETSVETGVYRPWLWARADADSTPGTKDNIARYAWYDEAGALMNEGEITIPIVLLEGEPSVARRYTCRVHDAYGAAASAEVEVTIVGVQP